MLKDIPYNELKKDKRAYEIMLLRDQYDNPFSAIAKVYGISTARARQGYYKIKIRQVRLYIRHIAMAIEHRDVSQIMKIYHSAYECYQNIVYVCAYLEKEYSEILTEYRDGEPGMPGEFLKKLPPLRREITREETEWVVYMRETKHVLYRQIAEVLRVTPEKAKKIYNHFYHEKVDEMIKNLQAEADSQEEKQEIWAQSYENNLSAKKRYEMLCEIMKDPS